MIIRSQNKRHLVNMGALSSISITADSVFAHTDDKTVCLGEYGNTDVATKVLDMIQEEYGKHYYGQGGQMATADYYVPPFAFIPPKVFQMPQDSEV